MKLALLALGGFMVAAGVTVGARWPSDPVEEAAAPTTSNRARKTRIRMVRTDCPGGLEGFDAELADLAAETARVRAETLGLAQRADSIGEAWPEGLNHGLEPDHVHAAVTELLPDDAMVEWDCDTVPCTAMIVLPDDGPGRAASLREALEAQFPGSTQAPWPVDREAYATYDPEAAVGQALVVQVMPELTEKAHKAWAYYAARHPRRVVREAMRTHLRER